MKHLVIYAVIFLLLNQTQISDVHGIENSSGNSRPSEITCHKLLSPAAADCRTLQSHCEGCGATGDDLFDAATCSSIVTRMFGYIDLFLTDGCYEAFAETPLHRLYGPYEEAVHCCESSTL